MNSYDVDVPMQLRLCDVGPMPSPLSDAVSRNMSAQLIFAEMELAVLRGADGQYKVLGGRSVAALFGLRMQQGHIDCGLLPRDTSVWCLVFVHPTTDGLTPTCVLPLKPHASTAGAPKV